MIRVITGLVLLQLALCTSVLFSQDVAKPADAAAPAPAAATAQTAPAVQPAAKEEPIPAVQPASEVKPAPSPAKEAAAPKPVAPAAKNVPAPAKKDAPAPAAAATPAAVPAKNVLDNAPLSLIEINEGDFRYQRIQGYVAEKKQVAEAKSTESKTSSVSNAISEKKQMVKGLMGWFVIIAIILFIFILYRYSKKKRRRKVFRRIR
jgi:hypothetical protein